MGLALLPDFELNLAGAALRLTPRIGAIVEGELFEVSIAGDEAPNHAERFACTVIRPDGSCVAALADVVQDHLRAQSTRPGPSRVFRAAQSASAAGLFVYGTLMRGEELGHVLAGRGLEDAQAATVHGQLRHLGECPGLILGSGGGTVRGEFVAAADLHAVLPELDEIECARPQGEPGGLYRRTLVVARLRDGREHRAWAYVVDEPGASGHSQRQLAGPVVVEP